MSGAAARRRSWRRPVNDGIGQSPRRRRQRPASGVGVARFSRDPLRRCAALGVGQRSRGPFHPATAVRPRWPRSTALGAWRPCPTAQDRRRRPGRHPDAWGRQHHAASAPISAAVPRLSRPSMRPCTRSGTPGPPIGPAGQLGGRPAHPRRRRSGGRIRRAMGTPHRAVSGGDKTAWVAIRRGWGWAALAPRRLTRPVARRVGARAGPRCPRAQPPPPRPDRDRPVRLSRACPDRHATLRPGRPRRRPMHPVAAGAEGRMRTADIAVAPSERRPLGDGRPVGGGRPGPRARAPSSHRPLGGSSPMRRTRAYDAMTVIRLTRVERDQLKDAARRHGRGLSRYLVERGLADGAGAGAGAAPRLRARDGPAAPRRQHPRPGRAPSSPPAGA